MRPQRPTRQPHGTFTRYVAGCSCLPCCDAWCDYQRERREGPARWIDVEPVRAHLRSLYAAGYSRRAVSSATGVSFGTLRIIDGTSMCDGRYTTRCHRDNAEAIMAVDEALPGDYSGYIPAGPTREIVRRLRRTAGRNEVARKIGKSPTWVGDICQPKGHPHHNERVQARTALAVQIALNASEKPSLRMDAEAVDTLLEQHSWDPEAIASASDCPAAVWYQIRSGRAVGEDRAERIARALGVEVGRVFVSIKRQDAA